MQSFWGYRRCAAPLPARPRRHALTPRAQCDINNRYVVIPEQLHVPPHQVEAFNIAKDDDRVALRGQVRGRVHERVDERVRVRARDAPET